MAISSIPEEINRHIEAVLVLSKRDLLLRVLREAELCLQLEDLTAATVLAGVALDEACLLVAPNASDEQGAYLEIWREMHNRAVHPSLDRAAPGKEEVKAMLTGIRSLLEQIATPESRPAEDALAETRGKYAFVATSVEQFLKRKHDDLELETQ